jgi:hypothetical protein
MMTAKASALLILAYLLALAAGTTSGVLAERLHSQVPLMATAPLAAQLQLTPAQCAQIRGVWEGVSHTLDSCYQQAQAVQQQRDEMLYNLLTDDQKAKFAIMDRNFAQQFAVLLAQRTAAFNDGLTRTEGMLTDAQRAKYQQIIHDRLGAGSPISSARAQPSLQDLQP